MTTDRRSWDDSSAESAIANFNQAASQLEALIAQRDSDVRSAMSDYTADGVSDEYQAKETRWHTVADEVKNIITGLRASLEESGSIAQSAASRAANAVADIG
ncbi:MAG: hypothetical protein LBI84_01085 [Propionibacteriaceae bacterium]|jgi:hypothetical protein|nr:hypothetical protein [Propionibacteriaceae bacterium]